MNGGSRDFRNWVEYEQRYYPQTADIETLQKVYDLHYSCQCEGCEQRKRIGVPPVKLNYKCNAPTETISHEHVVNYLVRNDVASFG